MAHKKNNTNLTELLLQCVTQPDPMLSMLEWLCTQLMEAEVDQQLGAEKSQRTDGRSGYRSGYRPRRLDTRMGTMYLMVPKVRQGGYIPFFVTERKRSEAAFFQVVQEAFVQGVSTRKMEKLAQSLGIENLSRSQVSEMTKGLNEQVNEFRNRPLSNTVYPILWVDALYEKVRVDGRIVSMAVLIVCGVDENGHRDIIAVETMAEESRDSYGLLFQHLKDRGLVTPKLIISDAHSGLVSAIRASFPTEDDAELSADFAETVMKAVAETPQSRPKKRQPWGKLAAAAACLAVIVLMQHGTLGSISGSSNTSAACDTAPMEAAAAESAPEERCLTAAGGDNGSDSFADTNTESKKTDAYYACALPPDQTTMENDSTAAMTDGSSAQDDLPTVTVSKSDLGELLDDREPTEVKPGVCRYLLTRQEFEDLAAKLADRGVTLKTEDTDRDQIWLEMLDE